MPTYEYRCTECGHEFEEFQNIKDEPVRICPVCNKKAVSRLISGGNGLIFKGSGFYITDYKNSKSSPPDSGKTKKPSDKPDVKKE